MFSALVNLRVPTCRNDGQAYGPAVVYPFCSIADDDTTLNVEPGAKPPPW